MHYLLLSGFLSGRIIKTLYFAFDKNENRRPEIRDAQLHSNVLLE